MDAAEVSEQLEAIAGAVARDFEQERRVLSFEEYLQLFAEQPELYSRSASRYIRDVFLHYGQRKVSEPWGELSHFNLFDLAFLDESARQREALIGHEEIQAELFRALSNFVKDERPNRVLLLHGPNGSAKSTVAACLMRALEHYSGLSEGALYSFHWVFPNQTKLKGSIGFAGERSASSTKHRPSYAHLSDDALDARLKLELRDHPLLLLPEGHRKAFLERCFAGGAAKPPRWLLQGSPSHKAKQVFDALLNNYHGDLYEVLRHVRVERYYISKRYRVGAVTLGPQLSVDAGERQLTADRSLSSLPPSLQSVPLYQAQGELIDATGGLLEFSDILKRPIDAFKYLQITAETGEVSLDSQNIQLNCVMLASGNELHLRAFREHHEFESFRGRFELIKVPYLLNWRSERAIYDGQIIPRIKRPIGPHATSIAAMFAVLTRLLRPEPGEYEEPLRGILKELSVVEKLSLYASAQIPERLDSESRKLLRASISLIHGETKHHVDYEGSFGASPRELRGVLLDAAQSPHYSYLSPFAVLAELDKLCARTSEFAWLQIDPSEHGYHDYKYFREYLNQTLLDLFEAELQSASGLLDERSYEELFLRYVNHVHHWVKGEKVLSELTNQYEPPDERMMTNIEQLLGSGDPPREQRQNIISRIAAFAIEQPDQKLDHSYIFSTEIKQLRDAAFYQRRQNIARLSQDILVYLRDEQRGQTLAQSRAAKATIERLRVSFKHPEDSIADLCAALVQQRYGSLLS